MFLLIHRASNQTAISQVSELFVVQKPKWQQNYSCFLMSGVRVTKQTCEPPRVCFCRRMYCRWEERGASGSGLPSLIILSPPNRLHCLQQLPGRNRADLPAEEEEGFPLEGLIAGRGCWWSASAARMSSDSSGTFTLQVHLSLCLKEFYLLWFVRFPLRMFLFLYLNHLLI